MSEWIILGLEGVGLCACIIALVLISKKKKKYTEQIEQQTKEVQEHTLMDALTNERVRH
ncbi:hypothetical protein [Jutongia hominis]|uniref:Uncharacterized protein n=1 Tax=Jutongia hominis TaxID=2763664 RepID=A0ABR7MUJ8_9FIRM|nr:hypothetical protein [Jutongia hominis]MBC8557472.1 hypothetical protein [Jutongia hominis]